MDRVLLELPSSIVFPRSSVGSWTLADLQRRRRCRPIAWPDANPACRLTVYHRAPVASSPTTTPAEHGRSSGSIRTRPKQMICTNG